MQASAAHRLSAARHVAAALALLFVAACARPAGERTCPGVGARITVATAASAAEAPACRSTGVVLQVLGSGGPVPDDERASSGYLLWVDGEARVLVDAGGGVFVRFGQAGAKLDHLDLVALTHLHTDHAADLPALIKGGVFTDRERLLPISGPSGAEHFPGLEEFLRTQFDPQRGAYRYLSWVFEKRRGYFLLEPKEIDRGQAAPQTVLETSGLRVDAIGVDHGIVPALAYRIEVGGKRLVIAGDGAGRSPRFAEFARDVDLLVLPLAISDDAGEVARALHVRPAEIAEAAQAAAPKRLVLSHFMARSLERLDEAVATIGRSYPGPITTATDLLCVEL